MKNFETVEKKLGFGAMRLPMISREEPDMAQIEKMVDAFMANGGRYFDSAFTYLHGLSESILGKALVARYPRDSFLIATKTPMFEPVPQEELYRRVDIQLERYGIDYFDYYLLHNVTGERVNFFTDNGAWEFLKDIKEKGIAKHIGFSTHDGPETIDRLLTEHPEIDFIQLQINFADWESENVHARENYEVAKKHGVPVVVMEPIKGGSLVNLNDKVKERLKETNPDMAIPEWALRFAASLDNVAVVLSGMSTEEQVLDNCEKFKDTRKLTDDEQKALEDAREIIKNTPTVPCTTCRYCMEVCPIGMKIPELLSAYNETLKFGAFGGHLKYVQNTGGNNPKTSDCLKCGACEGTCPQNIKITEYLDKLTDIYATYVRP